MLRYENMETGDNRETRSFKNHESHQLLYSSPPRILCFLHSPCKDYDEEVNRSVDYPGCFFTLYLGDAWNPGILLYFFVVEYLVEEHLAFFVESAFDELGGLRKRL